MRLTTRTGYALPALIHLGRQPGEVYVAVEHIAKARQIPAKFLEQILLTLKRAGCVRSLKGQHGGYQLAKPANRITLAEAVRLFDGPLAATVSVSRYFCGSTPRR